MPGWRYSAGTGYRYGFNGKENDKQVNNLTVYDYGFRIYNPAVGRFLSVDPLTRDYPWNSPYAYAENEPISHIDLDGLEKVKSTESAINAGVEQYVEDKRSQARGVSKWFTSWKPYKNLLNYGKDFALTATGDKEAIKRFNQKTINAINGWEGFKIYFQCYPHAVQSFYSYTA